MAETESSPSKSREPELSDSCDAFSPSSGAFISSSSPPVQSSSSADVPRILNNNNSSSSSSASNTVTTLQTSVSLPSGKNVTTTISSGISSQIPSTSPISSSSSASSSSVFVSHLESASSLLSSTLSNPASAWPLAVESKTFSENNLVTNSTITSTSAASEASLSVTLTASEFSPSLYFTNGQGFSSFASAQGFSSSKLCFGDQFTNSSSESCPASSSSSLQNFSFRFGTCPSTPTLTFSPPFLDHPFSFAAPVTRIHVPFPSHLLPGAPSSTSGTATSTVGPMIMSSDISPCSGSQLTKSAAETLRNTEVEMPTQSKCQKRKRHRNKKWEGLANQISEIQEGGIHKSDYYPKVAGISLEKAHKTSYKLDLRSKLHEAHRTSDNLDLRSNINGSEKEILEHRLQYAEAKLKFACRKLLEFEKVMSSEIKNVLSLIDFKEHILEDVEKSLCLMRRTQIVWPNSASEVLLTGSFDGWNRRWEMVRTDAGAFILLLHLYPGRYEIKFIVDGDLKVDPQQPTVFNNGSENNLFIII